MLPRLQIKLYWDILLRSGVLERRATPGDCLLNPGDDCLDEVGVDCLADRFMYIAHAVYTAYTQYKNTILPLLKSRSSGY